MGRSKSREFKYNFVSHKRKKTGDTPNIKETSARLEKKVKFNLILKVCQRILNDCLMIFSAVMKGGFVPKIPDCVENSFNEKTGNSIVVSCGHPGL